MRSLLLLRHATTEHVRPGAADHARRLTALGEVEAAAVGELLRERGQPLDLVLCSPATRTRQTALGLTPAAPLEISDRLYNAGGDDVLAVLRELPDDVEHVLVVGHAPGLPAVAHDLADPQRSDRHALATIASRFPPATLATLTVHGGWPGLDRGVLVAVDLP